MTAWTSPLRTVRSMPLRISLPADAGPQALDHEHVRQSLDDHLDLAVDDADLVDRHRPGGGQRLGLAGRAARTRAVLPALDRRARRRRPRPRTARCPGGVQRVADGVDVVADAHDGDAVVADLDPAGRARRRGRRAARRARTIASCQHRPSSLAATAASSVGAQRRARAAGRAPRRRSRPR